MWDSGPLAVYGAVTPTAGGGVAIDALGTKVYKAASTLFSNSTVITVGSGNALVITVSFGYSGSAPTSVSCTWNGVPATNLSSKDFTGGGASSYVFGLRSPASGAQTLALNWTNSAEVFVDAISFTGVDVTNDATAFPVAGRVTDDNASPTVAVSSGAGHYVVAAQCPGSSSTTFTGTTLYFDNSSGTFINAATNYDVGSATVNIGITSAGNAKLAAIDVSN